MWREVGEGHERWLKRRGAHRPGCWKKPLPIHHAASYICTEFTVWVKGRSKGKEKQHQDKEVLVYKLCLIPAWFILLYAKLTDFKLAVHRLSASILFERIIYIVIKCLLRA